MRNFVVSILSIALIGTIIGCGAKEPTPSVKAAVEQTASAAADEEMTVEMGCAMCIYDQEGIDRCTTAAKIGDKILLVDSDVDAHSAGLCKAPKNAVVMGHIAGDRLVASKVTFE